MPISDEGFVASGLFAGGGDGHPALPPGSVFVVECRTCGFSPEHQLTIPSGRCPKCLGYSWTRLVKPGGLLRAAEQATEHVKVPHARGN